MQQDGEINALIHLLDDDDREVYRHVHDKIVSLGVPVIPLLENAWTSEISDATHDRIEAIIHEIQFTELKKEWLQWLELEVPDLLTGYFLVSRYHFPDIRLDDILKKVNRIKQTIWLELNYNQTPLEQIQIFNQIFFGYHHFKGEQLPTRHQEYCIQHVLDTKSGSAISVGILYQIVANELNLPVFGVNLSKHYVLAFCKHHILDFSDASVLEKEVMFYINPVNKGIVFSRNEIKEYLKKSEIEASASQFSPSSSLAIIAALINYFCELHNAQNAERQQADLSEMLALMSG